MRPSLLALAALSLAVVVLLLAREPAPLVKGAAPMDPPPAASPRADPVPVDSPSPEPSTARRESPATAGTTAVAETEPTIPVLVTTSSSRRRDVPREGGIAFELRSIGQDPTAPPLAKGETDESGEATVELPADVDRGRQGWPAVYGLVVEPGYQTRRADLRPARGSEGAERYSMWLRTQAGATARGRTVDAEGRGVEAEVLPMRWSLRRGHEELGYGGVQDEALGAGWFQIHFEEDWQGIVLATSRRHGTGSLDGVVVDTDDPPQDLEVVVSGPGLVHGRVIDSYGDPAAGLELLVLLPELDDERGSGILPEPAASERRAEGGGRVSATTETDADGRFEVRGLRRAPYVLRARVGRSYGTYASRLTAPTVVANGADVELVLTRPHLAVSLLDAEGRPWSGRVKTRFGWREDRQEWPAGPMILVFGTGSGSGGAVAESGSPTSSSSPDDMLPAVFEAPQVGRYLVGAVGGPFDGRLQVVDVGPGAGRVPVVLQATAFERGRVAVTVVADGKVLKGAFDDPEFDLALEDPETAAVLFGKERFAASPFLFEAPPGRYRLVATGAPSVDSHHGTLMEPRSLGRTEADVQIVAGQTAEVRLELASGGRLEVTMEGEVLEEDHRGAREQFPEVDPEENAAYFAAEARSAHLQLLVPGRRPETVFRTEEWTSTSAAGTHLTSRWPLGTTDTSQVLPAGRYELLARMPGGREVRHTVEVTENATTAVRLRL